MAVPRETLAQHATDVASAAISTHAGKITFGGGMSMVVSGMTSTDVLMAVGILASVLGIIFGVRREIRETRKYRAEMAEFKQRGIQVD